MTMANRINRQWRLAARPDRDSGAEVDHFDFGQVADGPTSPTARPWYARSICRSIRPSGCG